MAVTKLGSVGKATISDRLTYSRRFPASQVRTSNATALEIVPAARSGALNILEAVLVTKPAGTAYGGVGASEDLNFHIANSSGFNLGEIETNGFLTVTSLQSRYRGVSEATFTPTSDRIVARLEGAVTGGDDLIITAFYRVIQTQD